MLLKCLLKMEQRKQGRMEARESLVAMGVPFGMLIGAGVGLVWPALGLVMGAGYGLVIGLVIGAIAQTVLNKLTKS